MFDHEDWCSASLVTRLPSRAVGYVSKVDARAIGQAVIELGGGPTQLSLVTAQHDRVVASYALLNAIGILSPLTLGLATPIYDPRIHYHQVRDSWFGLRTPDGK